VLNRELVAKGETIDSRRRVVLEIDSTEVAVYGRQEQSAYNGHFVSTAIIRCCCSMAKATAWRPNCARAVSTAPKAGKRCYCLTSTGSRRKAKRWRSAALRP
jgi:hypothetical protein